MKHQGCRPPAEAMGASGRVAYRGRVGEGEVGDMQVCCKDFSFFAPLTPSNGSGMLSVFKKANYLKHEFVLFANLFVTSDKKIFYVKIGLHLVHFGVQLTVGITLYNFSWKGN